MRMVRLLMVAASLLGAGRAWAGAKWSTTLNVSVASDGSGSASGDLYSARLQSGYVHIGCYVITSSGNTTGVCQASDGTNSVYCYSTDATVLSNIRSAPEMSGYISFQWNASRACTYLYFDKNSAWYPKQP